MRINKLLSAGTLLMTLTISSIPVYAESQGPVLTFSTPTYDCGIVNFDTVSIKTINIEFFNTGDAPLVLNGVNSCCGTVVTNWPKEPVLPGGKGTIQVRFRIAKNPGTIGRVISVASNDAVDPRKRYHITGQIEKGQE